ncbi:LysR family transcriptional regulator [Legionella birminghamensis]|uniref:LysR family transcriptional regulator n=1 Tax=Legionella birminghamensis TaxID=28083 RepID=A0A378I7V6_9GAMM|nr:LysR family transcriptional regulator [Legionella birminghamensis]KTC71547.1 LysR family transcriptional regulator [Legionella birminghamensis]STX30845.1 LysR family transcriptional regulator [Legionella birminghamensis]
MNSNELKSFLLVYEYRSYSIAAKKLFVTQSAISKRISNLEKELMVKLFENRSNMVLPTVKAKLLVPYARQLINILNNAYSDLRGNQLSKLSISLGTTLYPALDFIPAFIELISNDQAVYPQFHIRQLPKTELVDSLLNGILDLALATEDLNVDTSIQCTVLSSEELFIVVSPKHPLANRNEISWHDLSRYPCVHSPPGFSVRDRLDQIFTRLELPLVIEHELYSFEALSKLVKAGFCWSVLPLHYCDPELVKLKVAGFSETINLCWYCHKGRVDSFIIQYTTELFKQTLTKASFLPYCIN